MRKKTQFLVIILLIMIIISIENYRKRKDLTLPQGEKPSPSSTPPITEQTEVVEVPFAINVPPEILRDAFLKFLSDPKLEARINALRIYVPAIEFEENEIEYILGRLSNLSKQGPPVELIWCLPEEVSLKYSENLSHILSSYLAKYLSLSVLWKTFRLDECVTNKFIEKGVPIRVWTYTGEKIELNNLSKSEIEKLSLELSKIGFSAENASLLWSKRLCGELFTFSVNDGITVVTHGGYSGPFWGDISYTLVCSFDDCGNLIGRRVFDQRFEDVLIDDKTYLLSEKLVALSKDGNVVWELEIGADVLLPLKNGILAINKMSCEIFFVSRDGKVVWRDKLPHDWTTDLWRDGKGELLYIKTSSHRVLTVKMNPLKRIKTNRIEVSEGTIVTYNFGEIRMVKGGETVWIWNIPKCKECWYSKMAGEPLIDSGRIFLSVLETYNVTDGYEWNRLIYCLNPSNGELLWVRKICSNYLQDTFLTLFNRRLYATSNGYLYCFDYEGNLVWRRFNGLRVDFSPPIFFYDDKICSGAILCFRDDGVPLWKANFPGVYVYMLEEDSRVYIVLNQWPDLITRIYLIEPKS